MADMPAHAYIYRAKLLRVIDGDTIDVLIDNGFRSYRHERLRLLGVDAPEKRTTTYQAGLDATLWVTEWMQIPVDTFCLIVQTEKADSFGRFLAHVWRAADGAHLNEDLVAAGHAVRV